jgi:hypothetical protein
VTVTNVGERPRRGSRAAVCGGVAYVGALGDNEPLDHGRVDFYFRPAGKRDFRYQATCSIRDYGGSDVACLRFTAGKSGAWKSRFRGNAQVLAASGAADSFRVR